MKFYFVNPALHFFLIHYKIIIKKKEQQLLTVKKKNIEIENKRFHDESLYTILYSAVYLLSNREEV